MKTTINLYSHNDIIATSEVVFNPIALIECYIKMLDTPQDFTLIVKTSEGMGETCYILGANLRGEWNVVVEDDWFYPTGLDFTDRSEVIQYFKDCIRTSLEIDEINRTWA